MCTTSLTIVDPLDNDTNNGMKKSIEILKIYLNNTDINFASI